MSYCVNCGVKLGESEKVCPLCHTPVLNPNEENKAVRPVYSEKVDTRKKVNVKYLLSIVVLSFLVIALICLGTDLLLSKGKITWSVFCVVSLIYLSGLLQYIIQKNIFVSHTINCLSMEFFIFMFSLVFKIMNIYLKLLLPLTLLLWALIFLITILVKRKNTNGIRKISYFLFYVTCALYIIEWSIAFVSDKAFIPSWSMIASIPILIVAITLFIISFNKKLIASIKERMFI